MKQCPACNSKRLTTVKFRINIKVCLRCNAILSDNLWLGESYDYVLPIMTTENIPEERLRYYDFTCLASAGIIRRHGWYDIDTKYIVQTG